MKNIITLIIILIISTTTKAQVLTSNHFFEQKYVCGAVFIPNHSTIIYAGFSRGVGVCYTSSTDRSKKGLGIMFSEITIENITVQGFFTISNLNETEELKKLKFSLHVGYMIKRLPIFLSIGIPTDNLSNLKIGMGVGFYL